MQKTTRLPLIVGFGGYNAAGRSSGHQGYRRMVFDSLDARQRDETVIALASLMGLLDRESGSPTVAGVPVDENNIQGLTQQVLQGTLVRRIETDLFAADRVPTGKAGSIVAEEGQPVVFKIPARELPNPLPLGWTVRGEQEGVCEVALWQNQNVMLQTEQVLPVQAAGQLPSGFDPGAHYRSTHHPRGLQLAVMGASDAVQSIGISWTDIIAHLRPDEVSVYSSSVMSQLDSNGFGGMIRARSKGNRVTSKQLALGLNTMPADFVNAYVLGNVGLTGGMTGACATFLYNLRMGVEDIKSGRCRVAVVGSSEAPILPEVIDGYSAMGALATDAELRKLDGVPQADYRRASRPFGRNCGFTLAEASQYVVLMDDELALELGADIFGAVPGVYVNADGYKKSISAPGAGNYLTMAKSVALAHNLLGKSAVQNHSFVQAHGSSTPQNRVTESRIFDRVAQAFDITQWPVAAIKSYVGHSLGPASGDQLMATLGVFAHGVLPGIKTIDEVAEDVFNERLQITSKDQYLGIGDSKVAFLNSKGFGGNNATATVLAPTVVTSMLQKRYGNATWRGYEAKLQDTRGCASDYQAAAARGELNAIYNFGKNIIDDSEIEMESQQLSISGYKVGVPLDQTEGYDDLID